MCNMLHCITRFTLCIKVTTGKLGQTLHGQMDPPPGASIVGQFFLDLDHTTPSMLLNFSSQWEKNMALYSKMAPGST